MSTRLSPHFSLEELTFSRIALLLGLDNTPPPEHVANLRRLAAALEVVRSIYSRPVRILSGYRSEELNRAIPGAAVLSRHRDGLAADIQIAGVPPFNLARAIGQTDEIDVEQVVLEYPPDGWVHVAIHAPGVTTPRELLTAFRHPAGTQYMQGIREEA